MTPNNEPQPQEPTGRLSPSDVHSVLFTRAGLGRHGYEEVEVDAFLERVHQELTRLTAERAELHDEVTRLRSGRAGSAAAPTGDGHLSPEEAQLQAVRLLAAAQQTADVYVANAEKYSQRLTRDAREQSEAVLEEARQAARQLVADAERSAREADLDVERAEPAGRSGLTVQELADQVVYLRTFGQVVRVQLRAYLEALLQEVEDQWGRADPAGLSEQELADQVAYLRTFGQVVRVQLRAYLEALLQDVEDQWGRADPAVADWPALEGSAEDDEPAADDEPAVDDEPPLALEPKVAHPVLATVTDAFAGSVPEQPDEAPADASSNGVSMNGSSPVQRDVEVRKR